jgi:tetratricopeptide (TPR) repeat protein
MIINENFQLAVEYYQEGKLKEAENVLVGIVNLDPDNASALHFLGVIHYHLKNYKSAEKYIEKSLYLNPNEAFAYFNLANIFREEQRLDEAIDNYKKALQIDPDLSDAYYNLGIIFEKKRQIDEAITCYEKTIQIAPYDADAYNNLGLVLQKKGRIDDAIAYFEKALKIKPDYARTYNNLGIALHEKKQFDEAINNYKVAIQLDPYLADAYNNLGNSLKEKGLLDEAATCYKKTLQTNPDRADAYYNLGIVLNEKGSVDEAIENYRKAIQLNPDYIDAYINLGIAFKENGQLDNAINCFKEALRANPNDAVTHWNFSLVLLLSGNFEEGWKEYEWRLKVNDFHHPDLHRPLWSGSDIAGRTILLHAEQGFGDTIQFIRYAHLVAQRGAKIVIRCQKELLALLKNIESADKFIDYDQQPPDFDLYCHLLSLPLIFGTTPESIPVKIPYVKVDRILIRKWKNKIQDDNSDLKVGLVWAGREQRYFKLELFLPLFQIKDISFYSLQKGEASIQVKNHLNNLKIKDFTGDIYDFADTAAIIQNIDLVISVDTAVAHLAGALGKSVWVLIPFAPDWRWMLNREDSPWYPTMRLFRQSSSGDWESVIAKVKDELQKLLDYNTTIL